MGVLSCFGKSLSKDGFFEVTLGVLDGNHLKLDDKGPLVSCFLLWSFALCSGVAAKGEGGLPEGAALPAPLETQDPVGLGAMGEERLVEHEARDLSIVPA